jgi:aminocarboxymuconate-semialdehyde decarboxylase
MVVESKTLKIDVDTHFFPRFEVSEVVDLLPSTLSPQLRERHVRDAMRLLDTAGVRAAAQGKPRPADEAPNPRRDPVQRLEMHTKLGFDRQVLLPDGAFGNLYGVSPTGRTVVAKEIRHALAQVFNNASANAQSAHPNSFIGVATMPFDDIDASVKEVRRAVGDLGLKGVTIPGNFRGQNFDSEELYPFWAAVNELNVPVLVHHVPQGCRSMPTVDHEPLYPTVGGDRMRRLHIGTYLGFGMEYILQLAALTLGGVLEEFPNLKFCFFEAGAAWLPYAATGVERSAFIEPQCSRSNTPPREIIEGRICTAIEPVEDIEALVAMMGSEYFFFGTDFPHPEYQAYGNNAASVLDRPRLNQRDKDNILGDNIARVFGIA